MVRSAGKYAPREGMLPALCFCQPMTTAKQPNKMWRVAKVKGSKPDKFVYRSSVRASDFYSEELRSDLENRGIRETEIQLLIDRACANHE
jgi:hypothetical protein